jgi:hypothetical protein
MPVSTNATDMVRIVRRSTGPGYFVQHWARSPGSTSWFPRQEQTRLTFRGALKLSKRLPGPLTIEPHQRRETSAR